MPRSKTNRKPLPPVIESTLPRPRPLFSSLTPKEFRENEELRGLMRRAIDEILLLAFSAADQAEEDFTSISNPTDLARDALKNAERTGIARYKRMLLALADQEPRLDNPEPNYEGMTAFDRLGQEEIPS